MLYYCIISIPLFIYSINIFVRNYIIPASKRRLLYQRMQLDKDWPNIVLTEIFIKNIFKYDYAKLHSKIYRAFNGIRAPEFIYGEVDSLAFYTILAKTLPQPQDRFYDLGAGAGKAVFSAALFFDLKSSCGIELLQPLYDKASAKIVSAKQYAVDNISAAQKYASRIKSIQFVHADFLQYDFSDADIVYIAATCLNDSIWQCLLDKMLKLKVGSRIIVATRSIIHENVVLIYQGVELMSWGLCLVSIYKVRAVVI